MKTRHIALLLFLFLSACTFRFEWIVDSPDVTPVTVTATISPTSTIPASVSPIITPTVTATNAPTLVPTQNPTPTQENLNRIRITLNTNIRLSENGTVCRTALANSQFDVLSRSGDWLQITDNTCNPAWLFNGSWIVFVSGSLDNVPESRIRAQSRIGYNVNGVAIPDMFYFRQHIDSYPFASMLIMDNIGLACELANEYPDSIIIHRDFSQLEGSEWQKPTSDWIQRWDREGCKNVIRYSTNEPSLGNLQGFIQSEIDLMEVARARGFRVSVGNFGVGTLPDWAVQAGLFDEWLRALVRGNHIIGAHEYTTGFLPFGVGRYSREQLLDPVAMQPENWVTDLPVAYAPFLSQTIIDPVTSPFGEYEQLIAERPIIAQSATQCGSTLPSYWHILRTIWLILRAGCIGLNPDDIQIILTEGLWDNLADIDVPGVIEPVQTWRKQYGIDRYFRDMRGVNSYSNLWDAYYPQWTTAQAAFCQLLWWDYIAPDNYLAVNQFTWSTNNHWISFDFSGVQSDYLFEFHEYIANHANGHDMRPICGYYEWVS